MRFLPAVILGSLCFCFQCCAQNRKINHKDEVRISKNDSVRSISYLNKSFTVPLFSQAHQLYLDSALSINPRHAYLWQQKAMPLFKQKKYELGMPYLDSAVKYDRSNHWLEYRAFMKCIFQKSYREAIKDFNSAQKQNGNSYVMDHSYVFYKGLCYLQLNKFDSAEYFIGNEINKELKERNSVHYLHWFYLGIIQFEKEDYTKALESFDNCLSEYSQLPDAMYYKALCLFRQKQNKAALELALKAKENLKIGYTINEDNAIYESYPYQLNKFMLEVFIEGLNKKSNRLN